MNCEWSNYIKYNWMLEQEDVQSRIEKNVFHSSAMSVPGRRSILQTATAFLTEPAFVLPKLGGSPLVEFGIWALACMGQGNAKA
jgi:hypothetical protein